MAQAAYPSAAQIESYLRALGILADEDLETLLDNLDLAGISDAAKGAWEADTGWKPFLRDSAAVSRRFDPPGPNRRGLGRGGSQRLELEAGLLEITAFVQDYSLADAGAAVTIEDDYYLWPANAAIEGRPYTAIEFLGYQWGSPQSLRITGYWGYSATIPDDAWEAILRQAALLAYSETTLQVTGGMERWMEADVTEQYHLQEHADRWQEQWRRAVNRYRRVYL